MGDEEGLEPPPTTIRNRYHLVVAVLPITPITSLSFYIVRIWLKSFTLDFQSFSCSQDCNVFTSACIDDSSFRCSPSAYLMQISLIFRIACVLSPESRRSLRYPVTSFSTPLFNRCVKELLLQSFPNLSRCKIVAAQTTYFIRSWTYLCTVRDTHETELVRECDWGGTRTLRPSF